MTHSSVKKVFTMYMFMLQHLHLIDIIGYPGFSKVAQILHYCFIIFLDPLDKYFRYFNATVQIKTIVK